MPPLYAYESEELKKQVGKEAIPCITYKSAIEGKEYFCGCIECGLKAKVVFKKGKFYIKYGDSKNHSNLCKKLSRFNPNKYNESVFDFEKAMSDICK